MTRKNFNPSIYFIADPSLCGGRDVVDVVMQAVAGGATMVQLRNKSGNMAEFLAQGAVLAEVLKVRGVPFLINDDIEVAFAVEADGVHLGQGDAHPSLARARLGEKAIIGQTAFTPEHIAALDPCVDYIGTGPFYATKTDKGKPVLGAEKFAALVKLSPVLVVGIGGITPDNAAAVLAAGANGVAMMRSVSEADDPKAAVERFVKIFNH